MLISDGVDEYGQPRWRIGRGLVPNSCSKHRNDPRGFCREVLGVHPLRHQVEVLLSVRDNKSTAVASCHGAGKTHTAALVVLWFFSTRKPCVCFTTAPTDDQVKNILWAYISELHANSKRRLPGIVQTKKLKTESDTWYARGRAARDGNAAQGLHSPNLLIVYDEASGVRDEIRISLEGALGDANSRELAIGNPTDARGFFREAWEKQAEFWTRFNISALDLVNVRRQRRVVPGLQGHEWVEKIRRMFGEQSPFWVCRVLGRFFNFGEEKTIPPSWVKLAQQRYHQMQDGLPRRLLVDPAASANNDSTGVVLQAGLRLRAVEKYQEPDTQANARRILRKAIELHCTEIRVDVTGPTKGIGDKLVELKSQGHANGITITCVGWGESAKNPEFFDRQMDEMWFSCRDAFNPGTPEEPNLKVVGLCPDGELADELAEQLSVRGYTLSKHGKIKVESKPELRKRGVESPDLADALVMGFIPEPAPMTWSGKKSKVLTGLPS